MTTNFKKTNQQIKATKVLSSYKHSLLFGGSRSGKTFLAVRSIIVRACKVKSRHLIARFRFNAVKTSIGMDTLPKVMSLCFPYLPYKLNKTDWYVELPNGSQIWLAGTDDKERTEKVLGTEFSTIYFNESSQFSDYETITILLTRLAENTELTNRAWYDCNPPSKNHWSYLIFIKGVMPKTKEPVGKFKQNYGHCIMNPSHNIDNLPPDYIEMLENLPKRQRQRFLEGKFLLDIEGALWNQEMIDNALARDEPWQLKRTLVGVDPATTDNDDSDMWGIGCAQEYNNNVYSVEEDRSLKASPAVAIQVAINLYNDRNADAIVVETNQGGKMITELLRNAGYTGRIIEVHASKSKFARAEPVSALYEQGQIKHRAGLDDLENELMEYVPATSKKSPNRLDWLVWCLTELTGCGLSAGGF